MKTLNTVDEAIRFINSRKNQGVVFIINDCLYFGSSNTVHVYSNIAKDAKDAKDAKVDFEPKAIFTILSTEELPVVLNHILSLDKCFKISV